MAREVELKLQIAAEDAGRLADWVETAGETGTHSLRAIYYDTPGHALAKAGLTLRLRHNGAGWIQTIKAGGGVGAGLFERDEWEKPVETQTPELDGETPLAGLPSQTLAGLAPVFSVPVERRTVELERGRNQIELALDSGAVVADGRRSEFCEAELELKAGDTQELFKLAREIDALVPARLGVTSKSERGYRLLAAVAERERAEAVPIAAGQDVASGFATIMASAIRHYRLNEDILLRRRAPEALHQARVALRRMRSALSIFKSAIEEEKRAKFSGELKWLADELGRVRDLDVLYQNAQAGDLRAAIARSREEGYGALEQTLDTARARRLMVDIAEWLAVRDPGAAGEAPIEDFAAAALGKAFKTFKKASAGMAGLDDEARHTARKLAKKLRYAVDFFAGLYASGKAGKRYDAFIARLQVVQDELGNLNDLATAPDLLDRHGLSDVEGAGRFVAGNGKDELVRRATKARDALVKAKPFWG